MKFWNFALMGAFLIFSTSANAALVSRLGGLAYYDTEANLTWLADANAVVGTAFDTHQPGNGDLTWADANLWAASLNVAGVTSWRLPDTIDVGNDGETVTNVYNGVDYGYNITTHSELSNMFYNVLGNTAVYDTNGITTGCGDLSQAPDYCLTNTGPFSNLQSSYYWSASEHIIMDNAAWGFGFINGYQQELHKESTFNAWAVHDGDVSAVPVPAAIWLFSSGLIGLVGFAKRKKSQ